MIDIDARRLYVANRGNDFMGKLCCTTVESKSELQNFDCGNHSINCLIKESYFRHILRQSLTFKVAIKGHRVGFYTVSILRISFDDSDASLAQYYDNSPSFGVIKLDYIAVDKRVQKNGIGSTLLVHIVQCAKSLHQQWPIRILVLDALRERINWYSSHGFEPINTADLCGISETVPMYLDLMPEKERLQVEEYIDTCCDFSYD